MTIVPVPEGSSRGVNSDVIPFMLILPLYLEYSRDVTKGISSGVWFLIFNIYM